MAKSEVSAVTWAQSEDRDEKVLSGLRAQREAQALKIIELENSPEPQFGSVTILDSESLLVKTNSGKGAKEKESVCLKLIFKHYKFSANL
jgi:hypothetical protein